MRLTQVALLALRGSDKSVKERMAKAIGCSLPSLYRFIQDNSDELTKAGGLVILREITGLPDVQILEAEPVKVGDQK